MSPRHCHLDRLPLSIRGRFRELPVDPHVQAFSERAAPAAPIRQAAHRFLRRFVSDFDADGVLGTHPMALFGPRSWEELVGEHRGGRMLDVGAGSGDVTECARGLFGEGIVTTETSRAMARRLRARGFVCRRGDLASQRLALGGPFDVVALLNVLDRCDRPRSLLRAVGQLLASSGSLLVSVPLPARPHLDVGPYTVDPDEPLGGSGDSWEDALVDLVRVSIEPSGLEIRRLARAPYLSLTANGVRSLDAAVLVLRRP
jgi:SAM-dependent methyltransferase